MADQTQRLEIATVRAEVGSNIVYRFANDAPDAGGIPTDSGNIQNLKQVIIDIQDDAAQKISIATTIYQTPAAGLAATADGGIFLVQSSDADTIYTVWKNQAGSAVNTGKTAMSSQAIQDALTESNEAAQAAEDAADVATNRTAGFLAPAAIAPVTRDNGLPLQEGDRYFNTEDQAEYLYKSGGWAANDSLSAIVQVEAEVASLTSRVDEVESDIDQLQKTKRVDDYAALSSYVGDADLFQVIRSGIAGLFRKRAAVGGETGDGGTKIASSDGSQIFERIYSGALNVLWFGASTVGDSTSAFMSAYNACVAGGEIEVPGPGPYAVGAVPGTKNVVWDVKFDIESNPGLLNLPGSVSGCVGVADYFSRSGGLGSDFAMKRFVRNANYSGGTKGFVSSNIRAYTNVSNNNALSYEWVGTFILDNAGQGENVGVYAQANRLAASAVTLGGTFGAVFEARDKTQEANPTTGLIGIEVDVFANGNDSSNCRVGIDVVSGKGVASGSKSEAGFGIRIGPSNNDPTNSRFKTALHIQGEKDSGISIIGDTVGSSISVASTNSTNGISISGSASDSQIALSGSSKYGIRFSGTYSSGVAIRLSSGMAISLEGTDAIQIKYTTESINLMNAGTARTSFSTVTGAMFVAGLQVVGPRKTGWSTPTGSASRGAFDTSTVTLPGLAAVVAAMIIDNKSHGLYGS